ncbi:MAG: hypothetical protein HN435_03825 [Nitrospinaceae bacterium]|nr:hypothetical protein [Nitrospinaceae bacterium]
MPTLEPKGFESRVFAASVINEQRGGAGDEERIPCPGDLRSDFFLVNVSRHQGSCSFVLCYFQHHPRSADLADVCHVPEFTVGRTEFVWVEKIERGEKSEWGIKTTYTLPKPILGKINGPRDGQKTRIFMPREMARKTRRFSL